MCFSSTQMGQCDMASGEFTEESWTVPASFFLPTVYPTNTLEEIPAFQICLVCTYTFRVCHRHPRLPCPCTLASAPPVYSGPCCFSMSRNFAHFHMLSNSWCKCLPFTNLVKSMKSHFRCYNQLLPFQMCPINGGCIKESEHTGYNVTLFCGQ